MAMRQSSWTSVLVAMVVAVAVPLAACAKARHNHERPPRAPQWLRPDKMTREVYAEPVNSAVSDGCGETVESAEIAIFAFNLRQLITIDRCPLG